MKEIWIGNDWKEYIRQKVECFTRVMGYCRPVSQFNNWKKSEFYSRKYFKEYLIIK